MEFYAHSSPYETAFWEGQLNLVFLYMTVSGAFVYLKKIFVTDYFSEEGCIDGWMDVCYSFTLKRPNGSG